MYPIIQVFSDHMEKLDYSNSFNIPSYANRESLSDFDYEALCHWHPDLEFIYILSGSMDYFVNGTVIKMKEGEGIFVNSKRLHYGFSEKRDECIYICAIIHPSLFPLDMMAVNSHFNQKFSQNTADYIHLTPDVPWHSEVFKSIELLLEKHHAEKPDQLSIVAASCLLCSVISEHIPDAEEDNTDKKQAQISFLNMVSYIHSNFSSRISLEDIAAAGAVCRSNCCNLFRQYLKQSPNTYLTHYRIAKSCEFLKDTNMSISEIGMQCGFQTPSYFTSVFQKITGETPRQYRTRNT